MVIVRSDHASVSEPLFASHVRSLIGRLRRTGATVAITSYLDGSAAGLVSRDRHATIIPITLAEKPEDAIDKVVPIVEEVNGGGGFATHIAGTFDR